MENTHKVNPAVKFKKWVIMAFMTVLLALPMGSAFASSSADVKVNNWLLYKSSSSTTNIYVVSSTGEFYFNSSGELVSSSNYNVYKSTDGGVTFVDWSMNKTGSTAILPKTSLQIQTSNVDVYNDSSKTSVFFSKPKPPEPPAKMAKLSTLTDNVLQTITAGGILGTGLTILAIMLGVSLVPRLVRLFSH